MYLLLFARFFLVVGGINYFFKTTMNIDLFNFIKSPLINNFISLLIGISALYFVFNRDYYLPFLGECVMPSGEALAPLRRGKEQEGVTPGRGVVQIQIENLPPNTIVIAWGSKNEDKIFDNPFDAYGNYDNTYTAISNENGIANVELLCPSEYYVNKFGVMNKKLSKHIHYRYELPKYKGMFSRIYTKYLNC